MGEALSGKCCGQQVALLCSDSSGAAPMKTFEGDADGMRGGGSVLSNPLLDVV